MKSAVENVNVEQVAAWLRLFVEPDQVTELRALEVKQRYGAPCTVAGYYDGNHLEDMAAAALQLEQSAKGVYFVFNGVNPALLARRANRVDRAKDSDLTSDKYVIRRRWLLVDADAVRPTGISATDAEKAEAYKVALAVRDHLRGRGWPDPVLADSGNGYHQLLRIDLPAEDNGLVERTLAALSARFTTAAVKIDTSVHNPARITRLYGTLAGKGDDVPDRPHRRSSILEVPAS